MIQSSNIDEFINNVIKDSTTDKQLLERLLRNPKEVIESRIGFKLPEDFEISVHLDTPQKLNIVLPLHPEELNEAELSSVAGGVNWSCLDEHPETCGYNR